MSKTPIIHPHKFGTYITHTYVHTYLEVACPTLPRTGCLDRYPAISDQINLGVPTTHHIPTYICIVFVLFSYHRSTRCQRQDGRVDSRNNSSSLISLHHYMPVPLHHSSSSPSWPSPLSFMAFLFFFFLFCLFFFLSSWHSSCRSH